jgi:hypothetical protein
MEIYNPYKKFVGSFVPNWLMCRPEVSQGAKLCFGRLAQYAGKNGLCYPSQELLAIELGVKVRQARKYLKELENHKLIMIEKTQHKSNCYQFLVHNWSEMQKDRHYNTGTIGPVIPALLHRSYRSYSTDKENKEEMLEEIKEKYIKRKESDVYALRFYDRYPIKNKKIPTLDLFYKIVKKMNKSEVESFTNKILESLDAQIAERALKKQHEIWMRGWRDPTTWLKDSAWEDDVKLKIEELKNEKSTNKHKSGWDYSIELEEEIAREGQETS